MASNEKLLELTKDIVVTMINNKYISPDEVEITTENIFNKLTELNEKPQNIGC